MYAAVSAAWDVLALKGDGSRFAYQVVKLDSSHTLIDTRDDLLGDGSCVDMFGIKSITQPRNAGCDLVELDSLFASICGKRVSHEH